MISREFRRYYTFLLTCSLIPYVPYIFPFFPENILGFNMTGWAWIMIFFVSLFKLFNIKNISFPSQYWLPWIIYLVINLIIDFSFLGLQLTLQYILPIIIGLICSSFKYNAISLIWLFKQFLKLCILVFGLFIFGFFFRDGYTAASASTPMLISIYVSILIGLFFLTKKIKYILYYILFFMIPFLDVTRMGIAAFLVILIFHFANVKLFNKLLFSFFGIFIVLIVFNSKGFQEKTFHSGSGKITDFSLNFYENDEINNNGRQTWRLALEPGLIAKPFFGNGPRNDAQILIIASNNTIKEAHNDYLSVRYNYGYIGLIILFYGIIFTFKDIYFKVKIVNNNYSWLIGKSILTLFLSFLMFMYSDNILKYTIYFPNIFFAMIGIFYSLNKNGLIQIPISKVELIKYD